MATFYVVDPKGNLTAFPSGGGGSADLTSLDAGNLVTGTIPDARFPATLPASSGANLTNLNASNLTTGTIPIARVSGLTNTQIDAAAAIAYSKLALTGSILNADINASAAIAYTKLALTGSILNADVNASAAIAWTKLSKSGSSLADLATRSASDLSTGTLAIARGGSGQSTATAAFDALSPLTTKGDGVWFDGSHNARLAKLASKATQSSTQTIQNGVDFSSLAFDTSVFDVGGIHSTSVNNSRFTVPTGGEGLYLLNASVRLDFSGTPSVLEVRFFKNGTTDVGRVEYRLSFAASSSETINLTLTDVAVAADYYEVQVFQFSGSTQPTSAGLCFGSIVRIAPAS